MLFPCLKNAVYKTKCSYNYGSLYKLNEVVEAIIGREMHSAYLYRQDKRDSAILLARFTNGNKHAANL